MFPLKWLAYDISLLIQESLLLLAEGFSIHFTYREKKHLTVAACSFVFADGGNQTQATFSTSIVPLPLGWVQNW